MKFTVRTLYLYLFSFIGLIVIVIATVRLVDLGLRTFIFPEADIYEAYIPKRAVPMNPINDFADIADEEAIKESARLEQTRSRQRDLSNSISMLVVGVPLYIYHWRLIKIEGGDKKWKKH